MFPWTQTLPSTNILHIKTPLPQVNLRIGPASARICPETSQARGAGPAKQLLSLKMRCQTTMMAELLLIENAYKNKQKKPVNPTIPTVLDTPGNLKFCGAMIKLISQISDSAV
jgi:hypothetical protein